MARLYLLKLSVVDVIGADAERIVHNLTTNEIREIPENEVRESFVTDVKGKAIGHVMVTPIDNGLRLFGASGQSDVIHKQVDRYTITEDATPTIRDDEFEAIVTSGAGDLVGPRMLSVNWLGPDTRIALIEKSQRDDFLSTTESAGYESGSDAQFHQRRIIAGFPWFGVDFSDANLPQEVDRDSVAISFTKGCYLGQETIARLDALGQVQKKIVKWSVSGGVPKPGTTLADEQDKTIARLTSATQSDDGKVIALGMTRRSHFEAGSQANGESSGTKIQGVVLD